MTTITETPAPLTIEAIARKAVELADANPGFIYEAPTRIDDETGEEYAGDCAYLHREGSEVRPGCLYGHALLDLGMPAEELSRHEDTDIYAVLQNLQLVTYRDRAVYEDSAFDKTPETLPGAILQAQRKQDMNYPWGEAVEGIKAVLAKTEEKGDDK